MVIVIATYVPPPEVAVEARTRTKTATEGERSMLSKARIDRVEEYREEEALTKTTSNRVVEVRGTIKTKEVEIGIIKTATISNNPISKVVAIILRDLVIVRITREAEITGIGTMIKEHLSDATTVMVLDI